jgi:hypothetical protein
MGSGMPTQAGGVTAFMRGEEMTDPTAIGWTATIGLIPGYGHGNTGCDVSERRAMLVREWFTSMRRTHEETGFVISAVLSESVVLYPHNSCPEHGEVAMTLTGSSNPAHVAADRLGDFMDAVHATVRRVQEGMEQKTVRLEFTRIERSIYSRLDDTAAQPSTDTHEETA